MALNETDLTVKFVLLLLETKQHGTNEISHDVTAFCKILSFSCLHEYAVTRGFNVSLLLNAVSQISVLVTEYRFFVSVP